MLPLVYSRSKLIGFAAMFGFCAAVGLWLFTTPDLHIGGRFGLLTLATLVCGWRCALLATGTVTALDAEHDGLRVTTLWRTRLIPWRDLGPSRIDLRKVRGQTYFTLRAVSFQSGS